MYGTTSHYELLHDTLESLLAYVNGRFQIVRDTPTLDSEEGIMASQLVSRFIWSHRNTIDEFTHANPDRLSHEHLNVAMGLNDALYGNFILEEVAGETALLIHDTGVYRTMQPYEGFFASYPHTPLELRGAIAPCNGCIVAIPPLVVLGDADERVVSIINEDLGRRGVEHPTAEGNELAQRSHAWRKKHGPTPRTASSHTSIDALGSGFHRGALAGLSDEERARALDKHKRDDPNRAQRRQKMIEALCVDATVFPDSLEEGLLLLDDDYLSDVASGLELDDLPQDASAEERVRRICERITDKQIDMTIPLMWCLDEQFKLIGKLLDTNPLPLDEQHIGDEKPFPLVPYIFLVREGETVYAWMPPEVHASLGRHSYRAAARARERLDEVHIVARGLATLCGIIPTSEVFERYCEAVRRPLTRRQFNLVLSDQPCDARDDYDLWQYDGISYIISAELSDKSAPARVARMHFPDRVIDGAGFGIPDDATLVGLEEQDMCAFDQLVGQAETQLEQLRLSLLRLDRRLPPHDLPEEMLHTTPVEALMHTDALCALRRFVDAHIPDGEDDFTFADCFTRSIVISAVLLSDSYNDTMDVIRLYNMQDCDGTGYSDNLGRLVTNAYNSLPRWELNGWSLEENTQRITGRKRFFNPDGTPRVIHDSEPCPCGSGKPYGGCCGKVA